SALMLAALSTAQAQRRDFSDWELSCRNRGDWVTERVCNVVEKTIAVPGGTLSIDGRMNGGITGIGASRRGILARPTFEAHARSDSRAQDIAEAIRLRTDGGRIFAEGPDTHGNNEWWSVSFEIHVPPQTDLELNAHNGGIAVAGVTGMLRMETLNGGIHLDA